MTAGFLTRLAERATRDGQPAIRPDLPPVFLPGLLARAPAPDFEETGTAGTPSGGPFSAAPGAPGSGARPADAGPGRAGPPSHDAGEDPRPRSVRPADSGDSGQGHTAPPEAGHPAAGPASRAPDYLPAVTASEGRHPPSTPAAAGPPGTAARPGRGAPGRLGGARVRPHEPAVARAGPGELAVVQGTGDPAEPRVRPEPGGTRNGLAVPGSGAAGPESQVPRFPLRASREPDVRISIGRIEVRLQEASAAPARAPRPPRPEPVLPLEEYLQRRTESSR